MAAPHGAAGTDAGKTRVLTAALFRMSTLCASGKSGCIKAQIFRRLTQTYCAALP